MDIKKNEGFTLIELLIAMGIAVLVMAGVYYTFHTQQKSYILQEDYSALQQNIRSAMYFMEKEIRMAGCDPTDDAKSRVETFNAGSIRFTMDLVDNDGNSVSDGDVDDEGEDITYTLDAVERQIERDSNGPATPPGGQPIAENIDALQFYYLDSDGSETGSRERIRSVQIAVVARTNQATRGYTNNDTYQVTLPDGTTQLVLGPQNDHFHRRLLTTVIRCRNLN
ncbi:PilW family protein [Thermodesulfobacteriota bacterium]